MCTVSFVPVNRGFYLAINRDEKRSRPVALPPRIVTAASRRAIFPHEPNGGTWVAANDARVGLALINWYRIPHQPEGESATRGQVILNLAGAASHEEIADAMMAMTLRNLRPFRLIAVVPFEGAVTEWRWNFEFLKCQKHSWERKHWFSSGFEEARAELERSCVCDSLGIGGVDDLRRLHESHAPRRGPFSICMHRADAATVSYTEVVVSDERIMMRYKNGAPCSDSPMIESAL